MSQHGHHFYIAITKIDDLTGFEPAEVPPATLKVDFYAILDEGR